MLDELSGVPHRRREDVPWPGTGTEAVSVIRVLAARWRDRLGNLSDGDWRQPSAFPWTADTGKTVADSVLWVNVELTKDVSEIGQLRLLRAARTS